MNTLTIEEGLIGGQVKDVYEIENYPGFIKVSGIELSEKMKEQAENQENSWFFFLYEFKYFS